MVPPQIYFLLLTLTIVTYQQVKCEATQYGFDPSVAADEAIRSSVANYTTQRADLLATYTGEKAGQCEQALTGQPWYSDTDKALDSALSQALDKLKELDVKFTTYLKNCGCYHPCYTLAKSLGTHEVNKLRDETLDSLKKIKEDGLSQIKSFLDKCIG